MGMRINYLQLYRPEKAVKIQFLRANITVPMQTHRRAPKYTKIPISVSKL